jgi:putative ABC transport system permease protein
MTPLLRQTLRRLAKSPGYTAIALLTFAFGIGATTAIFSILNAVVVRPLPLPDSARLVSVRCTIPAFASQYPTLPVNARFYTEWRACPAFSSLALMDHWTVTLTGVGEPARLAATVGSPNLLSTLGVDPVLGRGFTGDDARPGQPPVAIISDRLWRERFSADPAVLGRPVAIDARPMTVIGVMPAGFHLPDKSWSEPDIYLIRTFGVDELADVAGRFNYNVVGRLAPGVSLQQAESQLDVVAARLSNASPQHIEVRAALMPLHDAIVGPVRRSVWILFGAVTAVLLLACLNLGVLGLARAERRSHDAAIRAALGASRRRIFFDALVEPAVLAVSGGVLGCVGANWSLALLVRLAPPNLPRLETVRLDPAALGFALGATVIATVLAGVVPAWRRTRSDAASVCLSSNGRTSTGGPAAARLRSAFIAAEIGIGTMLLAAAALLIGSFVRLIHAEVGFRAPHVLTTHLVIPAAKYPNAADRRAYFDRVVSAVSAVPGITAAALTNALPLTGQTWVSALWTPGDTSAAVERPQANVRFVTPGYFATLGIPLLSGRSFRANDGMQVAVISAQLAARLWPGQEPIGQRAYCNDRSDEVTIIGVVGDVRADVDHRAVPFIYRPHWAYGGFSQATLAVRVEGGAVLPTASGVRVAIRETDADVPLETFRTMDDVFASAVSPERFQLRLIVAFAVSALVLACLGIYGVVAHTVGQRTRELGIRLAFGATPAALLTMVVRQGMQPVVLGLLVGVAGSLLSGRLIASLLYETSAHDPLALGAVIGVLVLVALIACWLPARRATKLDPLLALRAE